MSYAYDEITACAFSPPDCTEEDNVRASIWRGYLTIDQLPCELTEVLKRASCISREDLVANIRQVSGATVCVLDEMEKYREDDCSELGKIRGCLWEWVQNNKWGEGLPKGLRRALGNVGDKDYTVPSDSLLETLSMYAGEKYLPTCLFKIFKNIRYCKQPCPVCDSA